jgi:hypothetical protein
MSTRGSFNPLGEVLGIESVITTTYTFGLTDKGKYIRFINANSQFVTVPPNSSVAFPVDTVISGVQAGAGSVVVRPGSGVTVNTYDGYMTMGQYAAFDLVKVGTDEWDLIGTMESDVTTTTTTEEATTTTTSH